MLKKEGLACGVQVTPSGQVTRQDSFNSLLVVNVMHSLCCSVLEFDRIKKYDRSQRSGN